MLNTKQLTILSILFVVLILMTGIYAYNSFSVEKGKVIQVAQEVKRHNEVLEEFRKQTEQIQHWFVSPNIQKDVRVEIEKLGNLAQEFAKVDNSIDQNEFQRIQTMFLNFFVKEGRVTTAASMADLNEISLVASKLIEDSNLKHRKFLNQRLLSLSEQVNVFKNFFLLFSSLGIVVVLFVWIAGRQRSEGFPENLKIATEFPPSNAEVKFVTIKKFKGSGLSNISVVQKDSREKIVEQKSRLVNKS